MPVGIERLGPDDWERFRAVRQRSLRSDPAAFAASAHRWLADGDVEPAWRERLAEVVTLVAVLDGTDVGTAGLDASGQLLAMWVDPTVRGAGVGRRLVDAVVSAAPDGTVVHLRVMADNAAAVGFYERCGFTLEPGDADDEGCLDMTYAG